MRVSTSSTPLYFTRVRLKEEPDVRCLVQTLLPQNPRERVHTGHRLIWSLFAKTGNEPRNFLWREAASHGLFYILSENLPPSSHYLFDVDEPKPFAPDLAPGDQLGFSLRANPTKTVRSPADSKARGKRVDVVMHHKFVTRAAGESPQSPLDRRALEHFAVQQWMNDQSARHGFSLITPGDELKDGSLPEFLHVTGYQTVHFYRGSNRVQFSTVDIEGTLSVTDPKKFLAALANGFGRAKSYGCGLMLIRRIRASG